MVNDVQHWINVAGIKYLEELGLKTGHVVVDFGCNEGHYSIPAASVVSTEGQVYAIDREKSALDQLQKTALEQKLTNITLILSCEPDIDLPSSSVDIVLVYDVLHYLNTAERKRLYQAANKVIKNGGLLSVFPKHMQMNSPMWHLADLNSSDIIAEIKNCGFILIDQNKKRLIHDDIIEEGIVLNFIKFSNKHLHER